MKSLSNHITNTKRINQKLFIKIIKYVKTKQEIILSRKIIDIEDLKKSIIKI